MIRHLLKPLWKRKGRNLLLSLELALTFVVVFGIAAIGLRYWQLYHSPVGFDWQNVWTVQLMMPDDSQAPDRGLYDRYERALRELPQVESVAFTAYTPYENSEWNTDFTIAGTHTKIDSNILQASDGFFDALGLKVVQGRAYSSIDDGSAGAPVLVNRRFAEKLFPGKNPIGQLLEQNPPPGAKPTDQPPPLRIVGVFDTFRNKGEFMPPGPFLIERFNPLVDKDLMRTMLLRVKPGTPRMFEVELSRRLKLVKNDASYRIAPMADMRSSQLRDGSTPLVLLAVIAAFLLLMVSFGLFGVLWQNTTRRTSELGLRRAVGATAGDITRQIVFEQVLLCLLPIAAALLLLVQLPITGALGENLSWGLFGAATLLSAGVMVLVSVGCALYPAWRASRLSPTEALHYE